MTDLYDVRLPEHVRDDIRRHRRRTALALGVVGLGVGALAVAAVLRTGSAAPAEGAPEAEAAPDVGVLAAAAGSTWHWAGTSACLSGGDATASLTRSSAAGEERVATPLRTLTSLAARDASLLVAAGRDDTCLPALIVSSDGGATWQRTSAPGVVDARVEPDGSLLVVRDDAGTGLVESGRIDSLGPAEARCPDDLEPRALSDSGDRPYLMCEDDGGVLRLLQRSTGGGWEYLTDTRPSTGLDGTFQTRDLEVLLDGPGLLLSRTSRCPEGGLRATSDGGASWQELPCPRESLPGVVVLDLAVAPDGRPSLLVLRAGAAVVVSSDDGGRTWRD